MLISQKCQYGLRAVFELAKHNGEGPLKIGQIAQAQAIPPRFLASILNQLKRTGFVVSRRGTEGGYLLAKPASSICVGELVRAIEGPIRLVQCTTTGTKPQCPLEDSCAFQTMWGNAKRALENVYDNTTLADLVQHELSDTDSPDAATSYVI